MQKRITDIRYELDEFSETIKQNLDDLSYDENELENIEERLDLIFRLKNKYGNTIEEISNYLAKAQKEFKIYSDNSEAIRLLNDELAAAENKTKLLAEKLTKNREKASLRFCNMVAAELKMLSMPNVRLDIPIKKTLLSKKGADYLEIFISVNSGEEMRPLAKVASGGEMSRIMLAIKNVISAEDDVATQIFDEIDTGISGIAAQKVGRKLYEVSRGRQVICVTHLAQVASYADNHLLIEKNNIENRTFTEVKTLNHDNRISEIARIISGEPISKIALAGAEELLNNAAKEKTKMLNKQLALEK